MFLPPASKVMGAWTELVTICRKMSDIDQRKRAELKEWLGLTPADALVYVALAAVATMFFIREPILEVILAVVGIVTAVAACPLGMTKNPLLSDSMNKLKEASYIPCAVCILIAIVVHYSAWNQAREAPPVTTDETQSERIVDPA